TFVPTVYPSMVGLPPGTVVTLQGAVFSCYDTFHDNQIVNGDQHIFDLWGAVSPNIMQGSDPRYAWVAFYKRDWTLTQPFVNGANPFSRPPYAQVIVIAVRARNTPTYTPADLLPSPSGTTEPSLIPSVGQATLKVTMLPASNTILSSEIDFTGTTNASLRAAEGAFVVISNDYLPTSSAAHGLLNGHVYRIGTSLGNNSWEFGPGDGLSAGDVTTLNNLMGANTQFDVFVVGRGADPNNPGQYIGPAQDVAVYSTFVPCPN